MKRTNCTNRYLGLFTVLGTTTLSLLAQEKPNVILILADDMGYSDIGCYGGEIETPNLDSLAQQGIRYSHFYNGARSCPTRAALMTGLYAHQAGIGWMTNAHESINGAYEGDLSKNALTIGEYLKQDNYKTYMIGKWHLTSYRKVNHKVKDNWPLQRGFDEFYGIVGGAANYFTTPVNIGNADGVEQALPAFILPMPSVIKQQNLSETMAMILSLCMLPTMLLTGPYMPKLKISPSMTANIVSDGTR